MALPDDEPLRPVRPAVIAELLDVMVTLGWAFLAWIVVMAVGGTALLLGTTALLLQTGRALRHIWRRLHHHTDHT
ncbi:hypothetical protein ABTZ78_17090 [Streptomyces bauhiniae]|uniref:hypothetical protein n=1 Tax=Streptomyces bauhiniae TaxID=2340725 RepID=UPI00331C788C